MTFDELEHSLPNGLHDAALVGLQMNYANQELVLDVDVDISELPRREQEFRRGRLLFSGVRFLVIDAPRENHAGPLWICAGSGQPSTSPCALPEIPKDYFLCWLFVVDWNSFIRIAARSVTHEWIDSERREQ